MTETGTALRVLGEDAILVGRHFPVERYDEWKALLAWCEFHGLDPARMPLGQLIVRNLAQCRIEYEEFVLDEQGRRQIDPETRDRPHPELIRRRVHVQGETPPMPFPDVILAHLNQPRETA